MEPKERVLKKDFRMSLLFLRTMYLVIAVYQSQASLWRNKYQELQKKRRKIST